MEKQRKNSTVQKKIMHFPKRHESSTPVSISSVSLIDVEDNFGSCLLK